MSLRYHCFSGPGWVLFHSTRSGGNLAVFQKAADGTGETKLIKKIDESLEKIENEDYGYCEACGVEIGVKRLEARPTATLCIDCKILDEIKEKQMGRKNKHTIY